MPKQLLAATVSFKCASVEKAKAFWGALTQNEICAQRTGCSVELHHTHIDQANVVFRSLKAGEPLTTSEILYTWVNTELINANDCCRKSVEAGIKHLESLDK